MFERRSMLIVDDELIHQLWLKEVFERRGIKVFVAMNGKEAIIEYIKNIPDFVLMDLNMPFVRGDIAASIIRVYEERVGNKHVPIIAVTAEEKCDFESKHFDGYCEKPVNFRILNNVIEAIFHRKEDL